MRNRCYPRYLCTNIRNTTVGLPRIPPIPLTHPPANELYGSPNLHLKVNDPQQALNLDNLAGRSRANDVPLLDRPLRDGCASSVPFNSLQNFCHSYLAARVQKDPGLLFAELGREAPSFNHVEEKVLGTVTPEK